LSPSDFCTPANCSENSSLVWHIMGEKHLWETVQYISIHEDISRGLKCIRCIQGEKRCHISLCYDARKLNAHLNAY
jgi:hypothetical protein